MALQKRLVVYGRSLRDGPDLDVLLRSRDFQVYAVDAEDELLDSLEFSRPDAAIVAAPSDLATILRLLSECRRVGHSVLIVVRPQAPVHDAISMLDGGADHVVTSFHPDWLAAQIRAALRRYGMDRSAPSIIELGYLCIDLQQRQVTVNERAVSLTRTEFDVLRVLAERPGTVLPSGEIMQHVMGIRIPESEAQDLLKVHVHRLRQKLEHDSDHPRFIRTVRGQGYMYAFERRARERDQAAGEGDRRTAN